MIASVFVPQAYCRYGCPTGELLHLIKSGGRHDKITRRDWTAGRFLTLLAAVILFFAVFPSYWSFGRRGKPINPTVSEFSGRAVSEPPGR